MGNHAASHLDYVRRAVTVHPDDERDHPTGPSSSWSETWEFRAATDDRATAVAVAVVRRPAEGQVSYRAALLGRSRPPVIVIDHELTPPRVGLEIRGSGIWADHICEQPHEHWTLGLECFALALSEPDQLLDKERGLPIAFGFDLGWEADRKPTPIESDHDSGYHATGTMHGEILLGDDRVDFAGTSARLHRWGSGPGLPAWWSLGTDAGIGTPPMSPGFEVDARVASRDALGQVVDLAVGTVVDSSGVHGPLWRSSVSA